MKELKLMKIKKNNNIKSLLNIDKKPHKRKYECPKEEYSDDIYLNIKNLLY